MSKKNRNALLHKITEKQMKEFARRDAKEEDMRRNPGKASRVQMGVPCISQQSSFSLAVILLIKATSLIWSLLRRTQNDKL